MARKIIAASAGLFLGLGLVFSAHADSLLEANIRAAVSKDPRSQLLSPTEFQSLIQALTEKSQKEGIDPASLAPAIDAQFEATAEISACEGVPLICYLAFYLGISLVEAWWLALGFLAGVLIILFFYHHHHHKMMLKQKPRLYV
ncbi:hypothetical protein EBR66_04835 [bacterium]|nr:hypothetical protein [bacterium]